MQVLQSVSLTFQKEQLSSIPTQDGHSHDANSEVDGGRVHRPVHSADDRFAM